MIKRGLEGAIFSGAVPVGILFLISIQGLFNYTTKQEYYRNISILMLSIFLLGILIVVFFFVKNYYQTSSKDRVRSLSGRQVYTVSGDYIGVVKDVLVSVKTPAIYGIKVNLSKNNKKVLIRAKNVRNYGEVILIDSALIDKI